LEEGEDYINWSGTKVNIYTFPFFSPISFHCFVISVLEFQKKKKKKPSQKIPYQEQQKSL